VGEPAMIARILIALSICAAIAASAHAGAEPLLPAPVNLQRDAVQARERSKPVVVLFTLPGCAFCQEVRQNYLAPLLRALPASSRPIIREIDITSEQSFVGFEGEPTSQQRFAKKLNIRFAPTVVFLDAFGHLLTAPIVGGDTAGLYGGYLENAFAEAEKKISAARQNNSKGGHP
jgi:thioredoxin-related protein